MFFNKLKSIVTILLGVALLCSTAPGWLSFARSSASAEPSGTPTPAASAPDAQRIQGTWKALRCELEGRDVPPWDLTVTIADVTIWIDDSGLKRQYSYRLDPSQRPGHIDWVARFGVDEGKIIPGIYRLEGDRLVFCTAGLRDNRPRAFKTEAGQHTFLLELRREHPAPRAKQLLDDEQFTERWHRRFRKLAQDADEARGQYPVDLAEVHNKPEYKNTCTLCHRAAGRAEHIDKLVESKGSEPLIIRWPSKADPAGDTQFLRRIFLDILGRTPTALELDDYLKDTGPDKGRKVVERLLQQAGQSFIVVEPKQGAGGDAKKARPQPGATTSRAEMERWWREFFPVPPRVPGLAGQQRPQPGSVTETLMWMNDAKTQQKFEAFSKNFLARVLATCADDGDALRMVYLRVLERPPTERELANLRTQIGTARAKAFEDLLWALVNSTEFEKKR